MQTLSDSDKLTLIAESTLDAATDNPEFYYDPKAGRYRYAKGTVGAGQFVPPAAVTALTQKQIQSVQADMGTLGQMLVDGKISLATWQTETANALKIIHSQQYLLGVGGKANMTSADYLAIGRELKDQYSWLRMFAQEVTQGVMSAAQFKARLQLYAAAASVSFARGQQASALREGKRYMQRFLRPAEHCPDCPGYAARGRVPIGELPLPTQDCQCRANCKCYVEYYDELEDEG